MMYTPRGRGIRGPNDSPQIQALRRPGEAGIVQRFGTTSETNTGYIENKIEDKVGSICSKISQLDFSNVENEFESSTESVKTLCQTVEDLEKCVETIFTFALKSKWNAHVSALFCNYLGDILIDDVKFRTCLLRKLQVLYKDRNKKYLELDKFLMDATLLCEIFHHMLIEGSCLKILSRPVIDYFGMLVDGASQKEIEVFVEQFPKNFKNLKENDPEGLDILLSKIRKQIVCETSTVMVKAMLLEIFELILIDWKPLSQNAKNLYESLSKPIVNVCS